MSARLAEPNDAMAIHGVARALGYPVAESREATNRFTAILESGSDRVWVYEKDNRIVAWVHAFIALRLASPAFVEIGGLVVEEECRKLGIGRTLVQQASSWAASQHLKLRVRCHSQRQDSHQFYIASGFRQTKSQHIFELDLC